MLFLGGEEVSDPPTLQVSQAFNEQPAADAAAVAGAAVAGREVQRAQ